MGFASLSDTKNYKTYEYLGASGTGSTFASPTNKETITIKIQKKTEIKIKRKTGRVCWQQERGSAEGRWGDRGKQKSEMQIITINGEISPEVVAANNVDDDEDDDDDDENDGERQTELRNENNLCTILITHIHIL